jgi:hypothetical protein
MTGKAKLGYFRSMSFFAHRSQNNFLRTALLLIAISPIALASSTPSASASDKTPKAAKPSPDLVIFTNGDQLTGQLERGVGNLIVFKSDEADEVTFSLDKVKSLCSTGNFAVLRKNSPVSSHAVIPGTIQYAEKTLTVTTPQGKIETLAEEQIGYIIDQTTYRRELAKLPGPLYGWNGSINGGATVVRSTDNGLTYNAGVALVRAIPAVPFLPARNRTSFNLQETYGKLTSPVIPQTDTPSPPTVVLTSIFHTAIERDQYFSPEFYALAQISFDHNYAQGLNLQESFGSGVGWTPIKNGHQQMDVKADLHYEKQTFQTPASDQNLIGSTLTEAFHRDLPRKLTFNESVNIVPAWNNSNAYSANALVALVMPVFKRLGLTVSSTDNFLNDPAAGYRKNSFQFVTAAAYTLR